MSRLIVRRLGPATGTEPNSDPDDPVLAEEEEPLLSLECCDKSILARQIGHVFAECNHCYMPTNYDQRFLHGKRKTRTDLQTFLMAPVCAWHCL